MDMTLLRRGRVGRRPSTGVVVGRSIVIGVVVRTVRVGVWKYRHCSWKHQRSTDKGTNEISESTKGQISPTATEGFFITLFVSSEKTSKSLTVVSGSRTGVGSSWGIVMVSLAVGSRVRHDAGRIKE